VTGPPVTTRIEGGVAWVGLARPASGNRLDLAMCQGIVDACGLLTLDDDVRLVVLQSGGRDFCRGLVASDAWLPRGWPDPVDAVASLPQPVFALVDGAAVGWGFALALACDVRIVTTRATFGPGDGMPGGGLTQRLPRIVGVGRAMSALLFGDRIGATQAVAWGIANEAVPVRRLAAVGAARARALAARGPIALRFAKEAVRRAFDLPLEDGIRLEHDLYVLLQTTADRREGIGAFLDKRRPRFRSN
jgi:enoyl-CoA hydratase/carnithine racemase